MQPASTRPLERRAQRTLERTDIDDQGVRTARRELGQHVRGDLHRRRDDDHVVVEPARAPVVYPRERRARGARIGHLDGEPLRAQELGEPRAHLARPADDQHALARPARLRGHARLLLMSQRRPNQEAHDLLRELGLEPAFEGLLARAFQHFALALIIARRNRVLNFVGTDLGHDFLPSGDQADQLSIDFRETFT